MESKRQALRVNVDSGLLSGAMQVPSPNADERPDVSDISLIVIHGISLPPGEFGGEGINQLFTNCLAADEHPYYQEICGLQVSSHLLIRRDGQVIQYVPFHRRAWHAGASNWCGRERCNDFAIGIELEGTDETPYSDAQYRVLADVIRALRAAYPRLGHDDLAGHSDIAPGRKTDPGPAFDWDRLKTLTEAARCGNELT